jgi:N-acetylglucosamine transport system substrate-binding protein
MLAAGIAPLAFQGKYPQYAWSTILSCYQRLVPFEKWYDIEDFKKGAFKDPAFVKAADLMQELAVKYFQKGALAMTHTESQMEWANGRAGMVFCGLWLKKEMEKALPDDFEMGCFPVPMVTGGTGDPKAIYSGGGESFFIFKDGKHPEIAADFLKFLLSIEPARDYVKRNDSLTPVIDCQVGIKISSALQSAVDAIEGSTRMYSDRLNTLYIEWHRTLVQQAQADLLRGAITGQQFADRLEAGAEAVRNNPNIYKPPARGVPAL